MDSRPQIMIPAWMGDIATPKVLVEVVATPNHLVQAVVSTSHIPIKSRSTRKLISTLLSTLIGLDLDLVTISVSFLHIVDLLVEMYVGIVRSFSFLFYYYNIYNCCLCLGFHFESSLEVC